MADHPRGKGFQAAFPEPHLSGTVLQRARAGDGQAIAALIQQGLASQGFTVEGDRQGHTLTLWIQGPILPPQQATVAYLEQGLAHLGVMDLRELSVYGSAPSQGQSWRQVVALAALAPEKPECSPATPEPPQAVDLDSPDTVALGKAPLAELLQRVAHSYPESASASGAMASDTAESAPDTSPSDVNPADHLEAISQYLSRPGRPVQASFCNGQLRLTLAASRSSGPLKTLADLYHQLAAADLAAWGLADGQSYQVRGVQGKRVVVWRRQAPLPRQDALAAHNTDLLSFHNRYSNVYLFPLLLALGGVLSALPLTARLLWGVRIWFHEFGHATVAWLAGRAAIPLPIGLTFSSLHRSIWVYGGVLMLLLLLYWSGWREGKTWPRWLAVGLILLQFVLTWCTPLETYLMWMTFGGVGGEFYLATLLIVSFYFPLPDRWRWEFYRYPAVLAAAFCLWMQVGLWQAIAQGRASIPWGALLGGEDTGDMNLLVNVYGWSEAQLIHTYNGLALACVGTIAAVYLYRCWQDHYRAIWHWWLLAVHHLG